MPQRPITFVLLHRQAEFLILAGNFTNACYVDMVSMKFSLFWENQADGLLIKKKNQKFFLCSWRKTIFLKKVNVSLSFKVITCQVFFSFEIPDSFERQVQSSYKNLMPHWKRLLKYYKKKIFLKENDNNYF